jgi:hypothetical protein
VDIGRHSVRDHWSITSVVARRNDERPLARAFGRADSHR